MYITLSGSYKTTAKAAVCKIKPFKLFRRGCVMQTQRSSESKKVTNKCRLDVKSKEVSDSAFEIKSVRFQLRSLPLDISACSGS